LGSAGLPAQPQALGASVTPKQELFVKDNRPVNLDIGTIKLPITAFASISHRITGVILVLASFLMLWALEASLSGPESFRRVG
jgi:succinate dehydrogenase / fumarate reductase cytochrome b subunit